MKGALALRNPVVQGAAAVLDTSATNVTSGAYVQILTAANMKKACSGIIVTNSGAQPLALGKGAAASEVNTGVVIPPGGGQVIIPIEIAAATRLSVESLGSTQATGIVTISFFA